MIGIFQRYVFSSVFKFLFAPDRAEKRLRKSLIPRHETQAQGRAHSKRLSVRRKMTAVD